MLNQEAPRNMESLHVMIISNHFEAKNKSPFMGIFVDRQIASLKQLGVRVSTFDIGVSHSPVHIVRKWLELRQQVRQADPDLVHGALVYLRPERPKPRLTQRCSTANSRKTGMVASTAIDICSVAGVP